MLSARHLPLALELAATRVTVLSPEQLLDRLSKRLDLLKAGRGVDPRHQTLRATLEWSDDLLDEEERLLFERLSVFRGGCTLEAAEEICDADIDTLQSLIDKSLLRRQGERFWMLETIREYAAEQLEQDAEAEVLAERHAQHFLALAEEAGRGAPDRDRERGADSETSSTISEAPSDGLLVRATWNASFVSQPLRSGISGRRRACAS